MKLSYKNYKDLIYENKIANAFFYTKSNFPKDYQSTLNKPRFTIKKSKFFINNLTYKKVNDWDNKNVISGERDNKKAGWRKFSLIDITKLFIISDLRKLGFNIDKINKILKNISIYSLGALKEGKLHKHTFFLLEYFFLDCLQGNKNSIIIEEEEEIFFFDEIDLFQNHFYLDQASTPIIILPFFDYVKRIAERLDMKVNYDKDPKVYELFKILPLERKILDIIYNEKYRKIEITKKNNDQLLITTRSIRSGKYNKKDVLDLIDQKDYQSVKAILEDGQIVAISQEERFWI